MSKRNHLHSFTLDPGASEFIHKIRKGDKSKLVSKAIQWYSKPREFIFAEVEYVSEDGEEKITKFMTKELDLRELLEQQDNLMEKMNKLGADRDKYKELYNNRFKFWKK